MTETLHFCPQPLDAGVVDATVLSQPDRQRLWLSRAPPCLRSITSRPSSRASPSRRGGKSKRTSPASVLTSRCEYFQQGRRIKSPRRAAHTQLSDSAVIGTPWCSALGTTEENSPLLLAYPASVASQPVGGAGTGSNRRGGDDAGGRRPPSVKAALAVSMGAPSRLQSCFVLFAQ